MLPGIHSVFRVSFLAALMQLLVAVTVWSEGRETFDYKWSLLDTKRHGRGVF